MTCNKICHNMFVVLISLSWFGGKLNIVKYSVDFQPDLVGFRLENRRLGKQMFTGKTSGCRRAMVN
ncbi:hypothetical protein JCM18694_26720 [Prolixibacter denitrificans]|uniref:Secreted protein n=1 Tax=Prolixibacter denitrificans TaxID=1541063 RepID=A0ABQ0ZLV5_9BACT|nr:hypothetical protein JCM18694_26720 [Prolixibacter denitrificans]